MTLYYVCKGSRPIYTFFKPLTAWHYAFQIKGTVQVVQF